MNTSPDAATLDLRDFRVDGWLVQPGLNLLVKGETSIRVRPQLIDMMACLAVRPGAVVSRDQLLATVWSDRYVCPSGIARCIAELRQVLTDDARRPRIIETIPKRGYRLIAPVEHIAAGNSPAPDAVGPLPSTAPEQDSDASGAQSSDEIPRFGTRTQSTLSMAAGLITFCRHFFARVSQ